MNYNPDTYIRIVCDRTIDVEVRDFQAQLRACLADTMSAQKSFMSSENNEDDALYTEDKFMQVKDIVSRFKGRSSFADADRRWTQKVTDVRNWFVFSASERSCEDDSEREFYADSGGKSGGQKEKLAYTVLAAALAFQLEVHSHDETFRFVMIDEAFGRGSDDSARYGLELFQKLGLQMLIVTPLQKLNVIDDYIHTVHLVAKRFNNDDSILTHMTVQEYRKKRKLEHAAKKLLLNETHGIEQHAFN